MKPIMLIILVPTRVGWQQAHQVHQELKPSHWDQVTYCPIGLSFDILRFSALSIYNKSFGIYSLQPANQWNAVIGIFAWLLDLILVE
jgi:hypothetical protein